MQHVKIFLKIFASSYTEQEISFQNLIENLMMGWWEFMHMDIWSIDDALCVCYWFSSGVASRSTIYRQSLLTKESQFSELPPSFIPLSICITFRHM